MQKLIQFVLGIVLLFGFLYLKYEGEFGPSDEKVQASWDRTYAHLQQEGRFAEPFKQGTQAARQDSGVVKKPRSTKNVSAAKDVVGDCKKRLSKIKGYETLGLASKCQCASQRLGADKQAQRRMSYIIIETQFSYKIAKSPTQQQKSDAESEYNRVMNLVLARERGPNGVPKWGTSHIRKIRDACSI